MCQRLPVLPETIACLVAIWGKIRSRFLRATLRLLKTPHGSLTNGTDTGFAAGRVVFGIIILQACVITLSAAAVMAIFVTNCVHGRADVSQCETVGEDQHVA